MTIQQHASFDSSAAELNATSKLVKAWESKNAKNAAKAGGISLMALSLAACGGSSTTTTTTPVVDTPVVDTPAVVTPVSESLTAYQDTLDGTSADDQFQGIYVADGGTGTTAFAGDIVNGAAGSDTFTINVSGTSTAAQALSGLTTTGVETLNVRNFDANANDAHDTTIDMSLMSGVTLVDFTGSIGTGDTAFTNVAAVTDAGLSNGAADMTMTYTAAAVVGTADTQNLAANNISAGTFTSNGVETISITTSGAASAITAVASDKLETLVISGDQNITISTALDFAGNGTAAAPGAVVDASGLSGKMAITTTASEVLDITGGSNNDTITLGSYTANDSVDGGLGTDRVKVSDEIGTALAKFTNVEEVEVELADIMLGTGAGATSAGTAADPIVISGKAVESATNFVLDANTAADGDEAFLSVTNLDNGDTITIADGGADSTSVADGVNVVTGVASDTSSNSLNVIFDGIGAVTADASNDTGISRLELDEQETVAITANKSAAGVAANGLEVLEVATATGLTFAGAGDLTIDAVTNTTALTSIDASAMTGALSISGLDASALDVKMAQKSSTVDMAGLTNADAITGGAGVADTLTATVTGLTATTGALTIANVENINLTTSGANTIDATAITGDASVLGVTDNKQTITNFDLAQTIKLGLAADEAATASEIDVTAADASGAADTLKVKVENTNGTTSSIIDASSIETLALEVVAAGSATLDLTTFEGDNVTVASKSGVTGTGTVALGTLNAVTDTVESTYAGAVTVSFANNVTEAATFTGAGTGVQNVTGTAANDTITIGSTGGIIHVVDGGAGTGDTVNLTATTGLVDTGSIDAENINISVVAGTDQTLTTSFGTGVDNITITGGNSLSTFTTGTIVTQVKTLNAATFEGNVIVTVADDAVDSTVVLTGGKLATDKLVYAMTATGTDALHSSAVEILDLDVNETSTLDLANATGIVTVDVDLGVNAAAKTFTVDNVTSEIIMLTAADDATADHTLEAKLASSGGAADAITFKSGAGTIDAGVFLKTTDIENVTINADAALQANLSLLTMATAGEVMTLTVTGDTALTIDAIHADVTTIDASGMATGGSVVQNGRSTTDAVNYTGSAGADTFMMFNAADVMNSGAGADTLNIDFTGILGGAGIDLSATDQVTTLDGVANSAVQTGFQHVDLAGYTNFGAAVTGNASANTITTTALKDTVSAGAGDDTIVSTAGNDVITLGAGTDVITVGALGHGLRIKDFTVGTDNIDINTTLISDDGTTVAAGASTAFLAVTGAAADSVMQAAGPGDGKDVIFEFENAAEVFSGNFATSTDAELKTAIVATLDSTTDSTTANTGEVIFILYDNQATANAVVAHYQTDGTEGTLATGELEILAVLEGVGADTLTGGDFI